MVQGDPRTRGFCIHNFSYLRLTAVRKKIWEIKEIKFS